MENRKMNPGRPEGRTGWRNDPLTRLEEQVIRNKATEVPFTGKYHDFFRQGTYHCRQCGAPLYRSHDKFRSACGWPAFDDEIPGAVLRQADADGVRTEILCRKCGAHLGHVFTGEHLTGKNVRHCVNSMSLTFVPDLPDDSTGPDGLCRAVLASGCFWGTEYWLARLEGVVATEVGYAGGWLKDPAYQQVRTGETGHVECVRVTFDPARVSYRQVLEQYFNTFDFEQADGQGPDVGLQYRSAIFYLDERQKRCAQQCLEALRAMGYRPAVQLRPLDLFYPETDDYHRHYYQREGTLPYCHLYKKVF